MSETTECSVKIFGRPRELPFATGDCKKCDGKLEEKFYAFPTQEDKIDKMGMICYGKDGCEIEVYSEKKLIC